MNALFPGLHWVVPEKLRDHTSWPKVDFATFDISAHRDVKYEGAKGTIRFEKGLGVRGKFNKFLFFFFDLFIAMNVPGEMFKFLDIKLIGNDSFEATLEFGVKLSTQPNCTVWYGRGVFVSL